MFKHHVGGTGNTQLRVVVASNNADDSDDVAFKKSFHDRHLVNIQGVFVLCDRCVVIGVDLTDDGFYDLVIAESLNYEKVSA